MWPGSGETVKTQCARQSGHGAAPHPSSSCAYPLAPQATSSMNSMRTNENTYLLLYTSIVNYLCKIYFGYDNQILLFLPFNQQRSCRSI